MKTLHAFCKQHNLPKTSVRRFLLSKGFSTAEGLVEEAQQAALMEFKPEALDPKSADSDRSSDTRVPDEVVPSGALDYYQGSVPMRYSERGLSLGNLSARQVTRNERRLMVAAGFQGTTMTREERRALIEQAALMDADDDAEVYAATYQQRLDLNLQRHASATVAVLGKDVDALDEPSSPPSVSAS